MEVGLYKFLKFEIYFELKNWKDFPSYSLAFLYQVIAGTN